MSRKVSVPAHSTVSLYFTTGRVQERRAESFRFARKTPAEAGYEVNGVWACAERGSGA